MRITPTTMPSRVHARARSSCKPLGPAWGVTSCFLISIAMMVVVFLAQITPDGHSSRVRPIPVPGLRSPPRVVVGVWLVDMSPWLCLIRLPGVGVFVMGKSIGPAQGVTSGATLFLLSVRVPSLLKPPASSIDLGTTGGGICGSSWRSLWGISTWGCMRCVHLINRA